MNGKTKDILTRGKMFVTGGYEKVNRIMDAVPLLRPKRNKNIAWLCGICVVIVALYRVAGSGTGETCGGEVPNRVSTVDFTSAPLGAESPEAIVLQYYKAYKDGDPVAFLNCVNYTDEEKLCMIEPLSEKMAAKEWRAKAEIAYSKIKYECEQRYDAGTSSERATANAYVEASSEWEGSSKCAGRLWDMKKLEGKWFIDKDTGRGAHWMGLTDLSNPEPTRPSN